MSQSIYQNDNVSNGILAIGTPKDVNQNLNGVGQAKKDGTKTKKAARPSGLIW